MPYLVVVYGAPLTGKSSLARAVAGALDAKAAIVSVDALLDGAIRVHDDDAYAELAMVYTQARLLVANYLKNRYHVVLEGSFYHERNGVLHPHEHEIDQTLALMRNLANTSLLVRLTATPNTLRERVQASPLPQNAETVLQVDAAYRQRYGRSPLVLGTDERPVADLAADVLAALKSERI